MRTRDAILGLLWAAWLAGWCLAAAFSARTIVRQSRAARLAHSLLFCAGGVLIVRHPLRSAALESRLLPDGDVIAWVGVLIVILGLACAVRARIQLGRLWSGTVTLKEGHAIVRTGPYALSRHPIYTGLLTALVGTVLVRGTGQDLAGFVVIVLGVRVKIRQEEHLLEGHFGQIYRSYRAEVPALIPRLRRARPSGSPK